MFMNENPNSTYEHEEFTITTHDPYGFCKVKITETGKVPAELSGVYTSLSDSINAINGYKNKQKLFGNEKTSSKEKSAPVEKIRNLNI